MSILEAFLSGFASFFSIWQVCILQISPFFMVFLVGLYVTAWTGGGGGVRPPLAGWTILPAVTYAMGFSIFYGLLSASGFYAGRYLNYHINELRVGAGVFFLVIVGWFLFADRLQWFGNRLRLGVGAGMACGVGVALALIYSPCITPALSQILGMAVRAETAWQGAWLALFYGLGMSIAFGVFGTFLIVLLRFWAGFGGQARLIRNLSAGVLLFLAIMNISGVMTYYKAFFLGMLVQ